MKKLLMIGASILIVCCAQAQKVHADAVTAAVRTSFAKQYPGVPVKWEKENGQFEASFKKNGKSMSAMYSLDGKLTETETDIKVADLPAGIMAYIKTHYKGKTVKEAATIVKADGTLNYEAEVAGKDVLFDAKGNFIREAKD